MRKNRMTVSTIWGILCALGLTCSSGFVLLDAFVWEKAIATESITDSGLMLQSDEALITECSYVDENLQLTIEEVDEDGVVYYVVDVRVSDIRYLKTAFAESTFGKNITAKTSEIAQENNAIFAINGDFYGFRDTGLIIRNGVLYRDTPRNEPDNQALLIKSDGTFELVTEGSVDGEDLVDNGVVQSFSFGPALVLDHVAQDIQTAVSTKDNPRTAIGIIDPLHYVFVVVDGRSSSSNGMTLDELAEVFVDRGCELAYNLDGGGSSTLYFMGEVINHPTDGKYDGEREVSDILFF
ncbi:MAG: phosphodiester glycosidase family protein [Erysipelotrichaceae bacterium]